MPLPTENDVHVDRPLTDISVAYIQNAGAFVAGRIFPTIPVEDKSNSYYVWDRGDFYRDEMERVAPGSEIARAEASLTTQTYSAVKWGLGRAVPDEIRANADDALDLDAAATEFLTQKALLRKEKQWESDYMSTSVWTGDQTGVNSGPSSNQFLQWDDSSSTPIDVITNQMITVWERSGYKPNWFVLGPRVFNALRNNSVFIDRIKHTSQDSVSATMMARLLDFTMDDMTGGDVNGDDLQFALMGGTENTAVEGASDSFSFIADKEALLVYSQPSPGLMRPSGGYTFAWQGLYGAGREGNRIRRYRETRTRSDIIELEMAWDSAVVASDLGVFFDSAVA